jgi:hypothetical protein
MIVIPHVTTSLVDTFGWRGAFRAQALYCSIIVALTGLTFRPVRLPVKRSRPLAEAVESSDAQSTPQKETEDEKAELVVEVVPPGKQPIKYWHYHRSYKQLLVDKTVLLFSASLFAFNFALCIPLLYMVSSLR